MGRSVHSFRHNISIATYRRLRRTYRRRDRHGESISRAVLSMLVSVDRRWKANESFVTKCSPETARRNLQNYVGKLYIKKRFNSLNCASLHHSQFNYKVNKLRNKQQQYYYNYKVNYERQLTCSHEGRRVAGSAVLAPKSVCLFVWV